MKKKNHYKKHFNCSFFFLPQSTVGANSNQADILLEKDGSGYCWEWAAPSQPAVLLTHPAFLDLLCPLGELKHLQSQSLSKAGRRQTKEQLE